MALQVFKEMKLFLVSLPISGQMVVWQAVISVVGGKENDDDALNGYQRFRLFCVWCMMVFYLIASNLGI